MKFPWSNLLEMFFISALITITIIFSSFYQKQITFRDGKGWDGVEYAKMAEQITAKQQVSARAPFVYRIGTSFLAAKLSPENLNDGFKIINICAGVIGIYLLWFWFSIFISNKLIRFLLISSYILYWQAPLRLSFYYPFHSDPIAIAFIFSGLIILQYLLKSYSNSKIMYLCIITFIGVFIREICLIPAIILFLTKLVERKDLYSFTKSNKININLKSLKHLFLSVYFIPLCVGFTGIIITHFFAKQDNSYSFFNSAIYWIYIKSLFKYFHAWFLAIGTIFTVILYYYSENIDFLKKNINLFLYLLIIIFISIAGGSDTERMIMWSIPVIYLMIGNTINTHKDIFKRHILMISLILTQLISIRAFLLIPDYPDNNAFQIPFLTPISNHFPLFNLWTIHGDDKILLISFAEYVTLALFLSYLIWGKDKNSKTY